MNSRLVSLSNSIHNHERRCEQLSSVVFLNHADTSLLEKSTSKVYSFLLIIETERKRSAEQLLLAFHSNKQAFRPLSSSESQTNYEPKPKLTKLGHGLHHVSNKYIHSSHIKLLLFLRKWFPLNYDLVG